MSNLTFDEQLIHERKAAEPLEGHAVVVLEQVGQYGERFHSVLEPGDPPPRGGLFTTIFGKPKGFLAFAVDASSSRALSFTQHVEMTERPHELDLELRLWYRAADPQMLVSQRANDPLGRLRTRIAEVVAVEFADLPWNDVWSSPRFACDRVVADTLHDIKAFARECGITVASLNLKAKLPSTETETARKIRAVQDQGLVDRASIGQQHQSEVFNAGLQLGSAEIIDAKRALIATRAQEDATSAAAADTAARFIRSACNPDEFDQMRTAVTGAPVAGLGAGSRQAAITSGNGRAAVAASGDEFTQVLAEVAAVTAPIHLDSLRRKARGALLRLVAAAVDEESAGGGAEAVCAAQVREVVGASGSLSSHQASALQGLADAGRLRARLDSVV
jgi:hypothetical protein